MALASRYSDDEPGSPWTWVLYLDAAASDLQRDALGAIFTGRLGGDARSHFPWAWKGSELVAVRPVEIDVDHTREELIADELVVDDGRLGFSYRGVCGYGTTFDYSG